MYDNFEHIAFDELWLSATVHHGVFIKKRLRRGDSVDDDYA